MTALISLKKIESFRGLPRWFEWDFRMHRFGSLSFGSATHGWLLLGHLVLHSNDAGRSWQYVEARPPEGMLAKSVFADGPDSCWMVLAQTGDQRPTRIPVAKCGVTGGRIEPIWVGGTNGSYRLGSRLFFSGPSKGWLIATESVNGRDQGITFVTDDGGRSWERLAVHSLALQEVYFRDSENGFQLARDPAQDPTRAHQAFLEERPSERVLIGGHRYAILATADGGCSWTRTLCIDRDLFAVAASESAVIAAGERGTVLRSSDRGVTWRKPRRKTESDLYSVALLHSGQGLAVGDEGAILHTVDDGMTWTKLIHEFTQCSFHAAHFAEEAVGVVADPKGIFRFTLH